ncbi:MAG: hypothetical protein A3J83_08770 [Elusimicrobia bacterium RIFOXYA2_FULL_40_6]|nr:MAG: hypothetical protein A3J83_08770 [Elusimicrobia bacterium RIFOXYA2_FULL_40_6]
MSIKLSQTPLLIYLILASSSTLFATSKTNTSNDYSKYDIIAKRNIFRPLWAIGANRQDDPRSRKEELEALKKSEKERQEAQKLAEEQTKLDNKKKEIEQNYTLTGIVFDNGKKQAIIQNKKGVANFLYENDTLEDLKVLSINNSKGEVILDYQGKFTVSFHLE